MSTISTTTNISMGSASGGGGGQIAQLNKQIDKLTQQLKNLSKKSDQSQEEVQKQMEFSGAK